mmetsp:Transcript_5639/g.17346  ORF Transcript_5639/g.17346 Transcript_5639/m.17346 type:complete len:569 (+) Transcript_5639:195-1901(+)
MAPRLPSMSVRSLLKERRRRRRARARLERRTPPEEISPEMAASAGYWRRLGTRAGLGVNVACGRDATAELARASSNRVAGEVWRQGSRLSELRTQIKRDGFFTLGPSELCADPSVLHALRLGAKRLKARGWPATMLLLYDEMWLLLTHISRIMKAVTGCAPSFDTLAWNIDPSEGQAGFAPHRDRQPADVPGSFRADGSAKYVTLWLALTPATTTNSCMHIIPRQHDPGYDAGDDHSPDAPDPLQLALRSDAAIQAIRACPLPPGGCLIFTHRAMHWGSRGCDYNTSGPRISVSFGCSDPSFEAPYLAKPEALLPLPPVAARAALAAAQLINYHERFEFSSRMLRLLGRIFRRFGAAKGYLTQEYVAKTAAEYKDACEDRARSEAARRSTNDRGHGLTSLATRSTSRSAKRARVTSARTLRRGAKCGVNDDAVHGGDDSSADDALDEALDAMLDAQMAAEGNLYDDFDEAYSDQEEAPGTNDTRSLIRRPDGSNASDDDDDLEDESEGEEEPFDFDTAHATGGVAGGVPIAYGRRIDGVATGRSVFHDVSDRVMRCATCGWELQGCMC